MKTVQWLGQLPLGLFPDLGELNIKPSSLCQESRETVLWFANTVHTFKEAKHDVC